MDRTPGRSDRGARLASAADRHDPPPAKGTGEEATVEATAERELVERIRKIEALYRGAQTEGEQAAALAALGRIEARLDLERMRAEAPEEHGFSIADPWQRAVFCALLRRHGIEPYRYPRQKRQTVMARIRPSLLHDIVWPEFQDIARLLDAHLSAVARRVIRECIHEDASEAEERRAIGHG